MVNSRLKNLARAIADWRCDPDRTISPPDMPMLGLATDEPELYAQYARLSPQERQYVVDYARRAAMLATDIAVLGPQEVADCVFVEEVTEMSQEIFERIAADLRAADRAYREREGKRILDRYVLDPHVTTNPRMRIVSKAPAPRPKLVPGVWLRILLIACACSAVWATIWWIATGERVGP